MDGERAINRCVEGNGFWWSIKLDMEILKPRFKVIASYPGMERHGNYIEGDILIDDGKSAVIKQDGTPVFACEWKKYPHLFKKLQWWEERDLNEMPKYILNKAAIPNVAIKVDKWTWEKLIDTVGVIGVILTAYSGDKKYNFHYPYLTPLTEEEYNLFIK